MIIGSERKRHKNCGSPGGLDLRDRRRPSPGNDQIRISVLLMKFSKKRANIRVEARREVCRASLFQLRLTGLVSEPQPSLPIREQRQHFLHGRIDRPGALAASEDENMVRRPMILALDRLELRADGIAGHNSTRSEIGRGGGALS